MIRPHYQHIGLTIMDEQYHVLKRLDINFADILNRLPFDKEGLLSDVDFPWLSTIDPYGNTFFNHLQVPKLISDLSKCRQSLDDEIAKRALDKAVEVLKTVKSLTYIHFIGD